MSSRTKELVFLILQFLDEEKFKDTIHKLEQDSGLFFNIKYLEDEVLNGNWDEVEKYLLGFTKVDDENLYSMKMFDEIRKQKYKERWDKYLDASSQFLTTTNFSKVNEKLSKHGDTKSARKIMLVELKKLIQANPLFRDKLQFPDLGNSRLRTLINQDQEKHILSLQEDLMRMQKEKEAKERELSGAVAAVGDLRKKLEEKEKEQAEQQLQIERLENDNVEAIKQLNEYSQNKLREKNKELQEKHKETLEKHKVEFEKYREEFDKSYATMFSEHEKLKNKCKEKLSEAVAAADEKVKPPPQEEATLNMSIYITSHGSEDEVAVHSERKSSFKQSKVVSRDTTLNVSSRKKKKVEPNEWKCSSLSESTTKEKSIKEEAGKKVSGAKHKLEYPVDPSLDELRNTISDILKDIDFETTTFSDIVRLLAGHYGMDLTHRKNTIKLLFEEELTKLVPDV